MLQFKASKQEVIKIHQVVKRAASFDDTIDFATTQMDLEACHCNGNPLDLNKLLTFDIYNLMHDVYGIRRNLDRQTGELTNCFVPRSSAKEKYI